MPHELVVLDADDVSTLFDYATAIASQQRAFTELGRGSATLAPKVGVEGANGSIALSYNARISPEAGAVSKLVSLNPDNADRDLPMIHGIITVLDPATGRPVAVMDGTSVTTVRTAAASAVAIEALATAGADTLVVVGTGVQAEAHVRACTETRTWASVTIVGRTPEKADALAARLTDDLGVEVASGTDVRAAVRDADVVALCTTSADPVVEHDWLRAGSTVVSVGSFIPDRSEIEQTTMREAHAVIVDDVDTALEHAGPIMQAVDGGILTADDLGTLGEVLTGKHAGRTSDDAIIVYNSVGIGVQDAAAAEAIVERAHETGRGQRVRL